MTDEVINVAIIIDLSPFIPLHRTSSKLIVYEISEFLLFLQTWQNTCTFQRRKLNISYQIVPNSFTRKFFRQQYFSEFDREVWNNLQQSIIQSFPENDSHVNELNEEETEKHFINILKKFVCDFYWENNDLASPGLISSLSLNPHLSTTKRSIAFYVSPSYYEVNIESKNTLKAIVQNMHQNGIAFIWRASSCDSSSLNRAFNSLSLFNGYILPFEFSESNSSTSHKIFSIISNIKPVVNETKPRIIRRKESISNTLFKPLFSRLFELVVNDSRHSIEGFTCTNSFPQNFTLHYVEFISVPIESLNLIFQDYLCIPKNKIHNLFKNSFMDAFIVSKNNQDDSYWIFQIIQDIDVVYLLKADKIVKEMIEKSLDLEKRSINSFKVFESWHVYSNYYAADMENLRKLKRKINEPNKIFFNYINNCLNGEHLTLKDSKNCSDLKSAFNVNKNISPENNSKNEIKNEIIKFYGKCQTLLLEVAKIYNTESEQVQHILNKCLKNVDNLKNLNYSVDSNALDECKMQVILRIFLLQKYPLTNLRGSLLGEVIEILRKLSLSKTPTWVRHFLDHEVIYGAESPIKKELRHIYDELMQPYPNSLESPMEKVSNSLNFEWTVPTESPSIINKNDFENIQIGKQQKLLTLNDLTSKRREITVLSRHSSFRNKLTPKVSSSLKNVKRSLFGNSKNSTNLRRCLSELKSESNIIFPIDKDFSSFSFDADSKSNPGKFYNNNSQSDYFPNQNKNQESNVSDKSILPSFLNFANTSCVSSPFQSSPKTPSSDSPKIVDKQFTPPPNVKVSSLTPWKYYKNILSLSSLKSPRQSPFKISNSPSNIHETFKTPSPKIGKDS